MALNLALKGLPVSTDRFGERNSTFKTSPRGFTQYHTRVYPAEAGVTTNAVRIGYQFFFLFLLEFEFLLNDLLPKDFLPVDFFPDDFLTLVFFVVDFLIVVFLVPSFLIGDFFRTLPGAFGFTFVLPGWFGLYKVLGGVGMGFPGFGITTIGCLGFEAAGR